VKIRPWLIFFKDLFDVLPSRTRPEWEDLQQVSAERPTVILVSGFGANRRNLNVIRKRLLRDGFNVLVLALDWHSLSDGVRGLYRMAEQLSSTVLRLRKRAGMRRSKIYLVAHSAGGLVARHYVQILGGSHYCEALITLATPHHGTWVAALGFLTHLFLKARCLFQMLPISPFIKTMNTAPYPLGFRLVSIYSRDDLLCPRRATRLPESWLARNEVKTVELADLSHSDFLLSKESYQALLRHLRVEGQPIAGPVMPSQPVPGAI
jgi:pimeloyl-ACP methyl ester carboxylesterase